MLQLQQPWALYTACSRVAAQPAIAAKRQPAHGQHCITAILDILLPVLALYLELLTVLPMGWLTICSCGRFSSMDSVLTPSGHHRAGLHCGLETEPVREMR
jgi:hypothetical protein